MYPGGEDVMSAVALRVAAVADRPGVIDEEHLERMTFGDRRLEREVLEIFRRQAAIMLGRVGGAEPAAAAAAIHTLKGSARGIGAWRVARAADRLERACGEADRAASLAELQAAALEARAAIDARLENYSSPAPDGR
jgi:HPt (histidine-containing phosphotransfer) domain-containing protein